LPVDQQLILDTGIIYTETAANNCDFGEVFTTDGRIPALNLTLVEDPGVNILYNVSGTIREEKYNEAPEAFDGIINDILAPLDEVRMAGLNALVSAEGQDLLTSRGHTSSRKASSPAKSMRNDRGLSPRSFVG
jgi:osmoprotectant transport system substrate-binding protein